ncbi:MAG: cytochrome c biogenesis CcdA family protein [Chloroflexota bacterium]|nr:cytochrome c biogenesis CcdA family protein [Chloroflexota bacterium]MDE2842383.1 cytochrome c biogenesis CcdA family protein [Chloroflexota bacterium]
MSVTVEASRFRSYLVTGLVAAGAILVAVIGSITIGSDTDIDFINLFVERLSGRSGSFLGGLVGTTSLFAFAAGLASAVNPCGFAMLPAYLGLYLGSGVSGENAGPARQLFQALLVGAAVTAGFVVLFGIAGSVIGLGASFVVSYIPWIGLVIGIVLTVTGAWLIGGGKLYTGIAAQAASRIGDPGQVSVKGYFLFGISYGIASLSCTLPIFLAVLGLTAADAGVWKTLTNFLLFALGMGVVIMALTLGIAFFRTAMVGGLRKALPYIQPIGYWLMVAAGAYIIFYWLTIGGL